MSLTLRQIRLVQHVAREGTMTAAARTLHLTQSALSHQLSKLERQLRVPVFLRTSRAMVPTAAGLRILECAVGILDSVQALDEDLSRIARGESGRIRLTAVCYTCYHWLPEVLPTFRERHPGVEVTLAPEHASRAFAALDAGEVDLVLSYVPVPEGSGYDAVPLFVDEQVLVVPPGHPLAERPWVVAGDFEDQTLFVHRDKPEDSLFFQSVLTPAGVSPAHVIEARLTEAILALVASGSGVAVVTRWTAAPEIAAGRLVPVRITQFGLRREWHAVRLWMERPPAYLDDFRRLVARGPDRLFDNPARAGSRKDAGIVCRP